MKPFIVLAALVAASQANPLQGVSDSLLQSVVRAKWSSFKAQHGKDYSAAEESQRLHQYLTTTMAIEQHNARFHAGLESFELGHNQMSDMTKEELTTQKLGLRIPENYEEIMANASFHVHNGVEGPANVDWRHKVQRVKDQGSCGSCYAFSAIGALEAACSIQRGNHVDLSEQHLVDCSRGNGNYGCDGGFMHTCFQYNQAKGAPTQTSYPYKAAVGVCNPNHGQVAKVNSFQMTGDERRLQNAVATYGPVSVAYAADGPQHFNYRQGIIDYASCPKQANHAVLCVGYGSDNGHDYWLIKNSWGTGYGMQGYFKMARGKNMCGIGGGLDSYPSAVTC